VHCVAVTARDELIVCRSADGWRFLPGGTREPRESLTDLVARELLEEAGAVVAGEPVIFAADRAASRNQRPYRSHMPHPVAYWAYAVVAAEVVQEPINPDDGEQVLEVLTLPVADACDYLMDGPDPLLADVVRVAEAMGLLSPERWNR
jgi:8-oxo-dGTP diphosphatase